MLHNMMLVFGSLLLCISALVNGDNVTSGIKKDGNLMNTRFCIYKERQGLHLFKANLVDGFNSLVDWSSEGEKSDCCKWQGVLCDKLTGRVIEIDLSSFADLAGKISSSLLLWSFNNLASELSSLVRIPFQLRTINLQSCKLGPTFPAWLKTQTGFTHIDIFSAGISDNIPAWFWDLSKVLVSSPI